ncbi:putative DNA restriction-modification system [Mycobacterium intracellulare subsp. yongonense]|uniref:TIGR02391 family protein n=1 Tax=Mycobacterium TaxID=1763 RepID=UPI0004D99575|nr:MULTISPECIES: TIGR02391 family protein [Mycobacterium]ARR77597.1 putative DNA restriction-modification system [Mycobacterium intracellulare subsp. yongonense]ARR82718.1 DNA restriction-modification system protein [Mycobacterium intracellulare subsp. yongonense]KEF96714.1 TIGR02391 family protein [Mycobacterium sp. TKK-01-0059]
MSAIDSGWAINALQEFIRATDQVAYDNRPGSGVVIMGTHQRASDSEVAELAHVAEQILDRVLPEWRHADDRPSEVRHKARWNHLRDWAGRGIAALRREQELREKLGDDAPHISAGHLHPWVWSGARSLWQSGHYRSAVEDAAKKVNAETQNKVGRRDVSETDLFKQAFSLDTAATGKSRLRRRNPDGTDTYKSVQRGAWALAEGIYAGIRNPFNHDNPEDIDAQTGLEYLAALSVLARWVDDAEVEAAP